MQTLIFSPSDILISIIHIFHLSLSVIIETINEYVFNVLINEVINIKYFEVILYSIASYEEAILSKEPGR